MVIPFRRRPSSSSSNNALVRITAYEPFIEDEDEDEGRRTRAKDMDENPRAPRILRNSSRAGGAAGEDDAIAILNDCFAY